ncbi:NAD(P)H-quinone oxidoreductase [Arsenicitalea aurantiaca]|uniref:NAD(P)H-quinone oxidoreductase n=2 Tax=Arsenicitalea aurantiaca TaxID=1783274 RepID=A0A433XM74_9HYPH|nr:NAD(P)H-quinone oxidoreductase [Arsenicitalea aurantiaca]
MTMTAIAVATPGGPESLQPRTVPLPEPGPGEVLVRVAAAGINYPDVMQRLGRYDPPPGASPLPGLEVSGEIASLGEGVSGHEIGARVVALCNGGGYAEFVTIPSGQVVPLPPGLDLLSGAAIPETFFTVQQTLVMRSGLQAGMSVLIHGAAGGIGGAAIQISRWLGARPIAVVSSEEKADYARSLGASDVIIHTRKDFPEAAKALTGGEGVGRIISIAGGDMLDKNLRALARFGTIIQLAGLDGARSELDIGRLLGRQATIFGSTLRPQSSALKAEIAASLVHRIWPGFAEGRINAPRIAILPLAEAAEAHRRMETRSNHGKLVLVTPWGESLETTA